MADLKKILSQALEKVWNEGDLEAIKEFYHPDFIMHVVSMNKSDESVLTFSDLPKDVVELRTAFPDFNEVVHDLIHEGDQVVARLTLGGTQSASYQNFPSQGKSFNIQSIDIYKFSDGKIIKQWGVKDTVSMHEQLGWD